MKRYKDCDLICNNEQSPEELLTLVEQVSISKGYRIDRYSTTRNMEYLTVFIKDERIPYSRLVIRPSFKGSISSISISNIIPMHESGISHLDYSIYNQILNLFRDDVFAFIKEKYGNKIEENNEDYTIQEIIPNTFNALNAWLSATPLSGHHKDTKRWYDFVITLHKSGEELTLDDFEKYIKENYLWDEEVLERFSLKLESELDLLNYYDEYKSME